jgi:hypothetical protein
MDWRLLTRRDVLGILAAVAILAVLAFAYVAFPISGAGSHWGFGPDWDCTHPGEGDPICIKKMPSGTANPSIETGKPPP